MYSLQDHDDVSMTLLTDIKKLIAIISHPILCSFCKSWPFLVSVDTTLTNSLTMSSNSIWSSNRISKSVHSLLASAERSHDTHMMCNCTVKPSSAENLLYQSRITPQFH